MNTTQILENIKLFVALNDAEKQAFREILEVRTLKKKEWKGKVFS